MSSEEELECDFHGRLRADSLAAAMLFISHYILGEWLPIE